jgi:hypothetical protein
MRWSETIALCLSAALIAGCRSERPVPAPVPVADDENTLQGTVVGDDRTAMEAAIDLGPSAALAAPSNDSAAPRALALAPNAPDAYVVKRGDTLWGIAKVFLRDPWFWPEIWQVNPQIQNPHLIYPGDTLRLVYVDGQPRVVLQRGDISLQRGDEARVLPRVRSQPLEAAVTTIPYETVAAFMSKPTVLTKEQINRAPYVLATRDLHVAMSEGNIVYVRGFKGPVELGAHYNVVRVGDALRDPDNNKILGYDGIFTGSGHITRGGDPATLIMTESARETDEGDKLFAGGIDVSLDFIPSAPKTKVKGRIMAVSDGVTVIGQYQVVVINRGARDGLVPGNVLAISDNGPTVRDYGNKDFLYSMTLFEGRKIKLPSERSGTFMVFKTFDNMSYGLIMEATNIIRVSDFVENP